jgi:hypothetical protein
MRDFVAKQNFRNASLFSALISVLCLPQISRYAHLTPQPWITLLMLLSGCFLGMTVVCGMVLAWSTRGNMAGWFPERSRQLKGAGVAVLLAALMLGIQLKWDPAMMAQAAKGPYADSLSLHYPSTVSGVFSLALWASTFETLFFTAGAMSFFVRISGHVWIGAGFCVLLRFLINLLKLSDNLPPEFLYIILPAMLAVTLCSCLLFAWAGLLPLMLFHFLLACRHVISVLS